MMTTRMDDIPGSNSPFMPSKAEWDAKVKECEQLRVRLLASEQEIEFVITQLKQTLHAETERADTLFKQLVETHRALTLVDDRANAAEARANDLIAERGVILNGYAMVANYALPYFEKLDKRRPSHDTAELLYAARHAIQERTEETNDLTVKWMVEMRSRATAAEAELAQAGQAYTAKCETVNYLSRMVSELVAERATARARVGELESLLHEVDNAITFDSEDEARASDYGLPIKVAVKVKTTLAALRTQPAPGQEGEQG